MRGVKVIQNRIILPFLNGLLNLFVRPATRPELVLPAPLRFAGKSAPELRHGCWTPKRLMLLRLHDGFRHFLRVAEQHHGVVAKEQLVIDAGVTGGHGAFDE